jgi:hypothetical protein
MAPGRDGEYYLIKCIKYLKMKFKEFVLIFVLALVLVSCEKETQLDIPKPETKLVVNSILVADQPIEVRVGKSNYTLESNAAYISNAIVVLHNKENSDTLIHQEKGIYANKNLIAQEGEIYDLVVDAPGFARAEATSQCPASISFADYIFEINAGIGRDGFQNKRITVSFTDEAETDNFYKLLLKWNSLRSSGMEDTLLFDDSTSNNAWYSYSPVIMAEGSGEEETFSDQLFNGQQVTIPMNFNTWDLELWYDLNFRLKVYLVCVDKSYYTYEKSYYQQTDAEDNVWLSNSPPRLYSNIEGAFGIFSAVNVTDSIIIDF